jgi:diaminopimelate epimerase
VVGVDDVAVVELQRLGQIVPYVNLEIIEPGPEPHGITMRVHERGAGITEACGTGACASAWAARSWGLVPAATEEIVVHMDGGDAKVRLHHPSQGRVTLVGPAQFIATVVVST